MSPQKFQQIIYSYFEKHKRDLPWRTDTSPYAILISEMMLQQTQVSRVLPKFELFIKTFPDFSTLSKASVKDILTVWKGLGYSRRALALRTIAHIVLEKHKGKLPESEEELDALPHIGAATAASIATYAFNKPTVYIETNIRTVYIHFFFKDREGVTDTELEPLVRKTVDRKNPRNWYWALMDYGTMLKANGFNYVKKSAHYVKQSPLKGSNREVRGKILKALIDEDLTLDGLLQELNLDPDKIRANLPLLEAEGFVVKKGNTYRLRD